MDLFREAQKFAVGDFTVHTTLRSYGGKKDCVYRIAFENEIGDWTSTDDHENPLDALHEFANLLYVADLVDGR